MSQLWFLVLSAVGLVVTGHLGYWLGRRPRPGHDRKGLTHMMTWQATVLGLLGLLIGFTFSMAVSRFDDRRRLIAAEANAIGTTHLRTRLVEDPAGAELRTLLRRYLTKRLAFYDAGVDLAGIDRAVREGHALKAEIWLRLTALSRLHPQSLPVALLIESTNEMFDRADERLAALENQVPRPVFAVLLLMAAFAMVSVGYACGFERRRLWFGLLCLPLLLALVIALVYDLAHPRMGRIRTGQKPLIHLSDEL